MLEIKNLTKIYSGRGGVSTKALDGVSIKFAETGLVFLRSEEHTSELQSH